MANLAGIARPYAIAAFETAREQQQLPAWKNFLAAAAYTVQQPAILNLLGDPAISPSKLSGLFMDVLASTLDNERKNFLLLLTQNKRLNALPAIVELFNAYYAALEKVSTVRMVTAVDVQEDFKQKLTGVLSKRTASDVTLTCEVDPAILGGAIIHIGDEVIDGSIRGKLTRLLEFSLR